MSLSTENSCFLLPPFPLGFGETVYNMKKRRFFCFLLSDQDRWFQQNLFPNNKSWKKFLLFLSKIVHPILSLSLSESTWKMGRRRKGGFIFVFYKDKNEEEKNCRRKEKAKRWNQDNSWKRFINDSFFSFQFTFSFNFWMHSKV